MIYLLLEKSKALFLFFDCSEKGELKAAAAAKVDQITAELKTTSADGKQFDSVERLKEGFIYFKREKYELVISHFPLFSSIFLLLCALIVLLLLNR